MAVGDRSEISFFSNLEGNTICHIYAAVKTSVSDWWHFRILAFVFLAISAVAFRIFAH